MEKAVLFTGFKVKPDCISQAKQRGYQVVLLSPTTVEGAKDVFDEIFVFDFNSVEEIEAALRKINEKYISQGIISNYDDFVVSRSYLAQKLKLNACPVYNACLSRNKALQRIALKELPENIDFRVVRDSQQGFQAFKDLGEDVYVKSISGVKSKFVFHVDSNDLFQRSMKEIAEAPTRMSSQMYSNFEAYGFDFDYPDPAKNFLVEKAEYGQQVTTLAIVGGDGEIWHGPSICDIYTAEDIGFQDSFLAFRILPSKQPLEIIEKAHLLTEKVVSKLGQSHCAVHTEFLLNENQQFKIIESSSRMAGYRPLMYQQVYGVDVSEIALDAALGNAFSQKTTEAQCYMSVSEILPRETGILRGIEGIEELKKDPAVKILRDRCISGSQVGPAQENYKALLIFSYTGETYEEVYEKSLYYQKTLKAIVD